MADAPSHHILGRPVARRVQSELRRQVAILPRAPKLAIIHASPDSAADTYVRLKQEFGASIGVEVEVLQPTVDQLAIAIDELNQDPEVDGIVIQLPLPYEVDSDALLARLLPSKDVDGLTPGSPFVTAGPRGTMELLAAYEVTVRGMKASLVGCGPLVGQPLLRQLEQAGAEVEVFTLERPIEREILQASQLIIGATGVQHIITSELVSADAVVVDATGVDVDPAVSRRPDIQVTPATGGVGPMTVAALFENLLDAIVSR